MNRLIFNGNENETESITKGLKKRRKIFKLSNSATQNYEFLNLAITKWTKFHVKKKLKRPSRSSDKLEKAMNSGNLALVVCKMRNNSK